MKMQHNYITPLPPQKEQELFQWYTHSVYALALLIVVLVSINGYQYYQLRTITHACTHKQATLLELQKNLEPVEALKTELAQLERQLKTMENLKSEQSSPQEILGIIEKAIPADACLTELSYHNNGELTLQGYARTAESALLFLKTAQETPLVESLELSSLAPVKFQEEGQTWYQFYMKLKKQAQA